MIVGARGITKLAVDVMGGDNAPQAVLDGVLAFLNDSLHNA